MSKEQYAILIDGKHVANVIAGSMIGAIGAFRRARTKHGTDYFFEPESECYIIEAVRMTDYFARKVNQGVK
jgi:hypothetical protein